MVSSIHLGSRKRPEVEGVGRARNQRRWVVERGGLDGFDRLGLGFGLIYTIVALG